MRLVVLADNNTFIDQYYVGEPAACYYIEDGESKILFDTGYSDVFIKNAQRMNIDLQSLSAIAISHGHNDHTGGIAFLRDMVSLKNIAVIAHPGAFAERFDNGAPIGSPLEESFFTQNCRLTLTKEPFQISENLIFLGEIPSRSSFERTKPVGVVKDKNGLRDDFVTDDSALVYTGRQGLFIITGCSHSGICNIIEHAKKICGVEKISGVIGGFHLFDVSDALQQTISYFKKNAIETLYPCHCVSFAVKAEIHKHIPVHEVGVGLELIVP